MNNETPFCTNLLIVDNWPIIVFTNPSKVNSRKNLFWAKGMIFWSKMWYIWSICDSKCLWSVSLWWAWVLYIFCIFPNSLFCFECNFPDSWMCSFILLLHSHTWLCLEWVSTFREFFRFCSVVRACVGGVALVQWIVVAAFIVSESKVQQQIVQVKSWPSEI